MNKKEVIVKVENIYKTYVLKGMEINALSGISLTINKGDFASIIGKSGSGKSTLMHIIGALDRPTTGKVFIGGEDIAKMNDGELAKLRNKKIGFVFQQFNLLQRTSALENVLLPLKYSKIPKKEWNKKAKYLIELVGLLDRQNNKPNELSGGQQQRVAIARALVNDPDIVLADEPTGNLDSKTGDEIMELFKKLNREGKTVIIVTHDRDIAKQTKKIFEIKDGILI